MSIQMPVYAPPQYVGQYPVVPQVQQPQVQQPQVQQPQVQQPQVQQKPTELVVYLTERPSIWSSGLCDCCMNPSICVQGCLCPCVLFGKNVERAFNDSCCKSCMCYCFCCGPAQHSGIRRKLRVKYNLPIDPCNDCCLSWFCCPCALCQEANEIRVQNSKAPSSQFMV